MIMDGLYDPLQRILCEEQGPGQSRKCRQQVVFHFLEEFFCSVAFPILVQVTDSITRFYLQLRDILAFIPEFFNHTP